MHSEDVAVLDELRMVQEQQKKTLLRGDGSSSSSVSSLLCLATLPAENKRGVRRPLFTA